MTMQMLWLWVGFCDDEDFVVFLFRCCCFYDVVSMVMVMMMMTTMMIRRIMPMHAAVEPLRLAESRPVDNGPVGPFQALGPLV